LPAPFCIRFATRQPIVLRRSNDIKTLPWGGKPVIDRVFDRVARIIELILAFAFIFAVLLNFTNVFGRYVLGFSLLGADEVQVFIMIAMTFVGAAVVTRRNLHLRMDVLVQFMPEPARILLRALELMLLVVLAGFVFTQSYLYAQRMLSIDRTSDMAGVPMWIPHGTVALGFSLMLIVTLWQVVSAAWLSPEKAPSQETQL
jgi:TRAP-type C4-dicarboxylate transport system permease small subunit